MPQFTSHFIKFHVLKRDCWTSPLQISVCHVKDAEHTHFENHTVYGEAIAARNTDPGRPNFKAWLPDGYSQIFRSYMFGPSGFWTMAPLCCAAKFCHLATMVGGGEKGGIDWKVHMPSLSLSLSGSLNNVDPSVQTWLTPRYGSRNHNKLSTMTQNYPYQLVHLH